MAAKKNVEELVSLIPEDPQTPRPRLTKMIIKNFRAIGKDPVEIDLDKIVVLVGNNNSGKSSILKAYELIMNYDSRESYLTLDDFPNGVVDLKHLPEVEVHTVLSEDRLPGTSWRNDIGNGEYLIRERWIWEAVGKSAKHQGFDVDVNSWVDKVPWGAPNVAKANRPVPHRIDAFSSPEAQEAAVGKLISDLLVGQAKTITDSSGVVLLTKLLEQIADFQKAISLDLEDKKKAIQEDISKDIQAVFPGYIVEFDANESSVDKAYSPFKENTVVKMGPELGYRPGTNLQGSGARRVLMWAALKYIAEHDVNKGDRPHVLLFDEPELCLHPSAIRAARDVLYKLAEKENWQVMITTHSPLLIDLSKDNTTIVRVERDPTDRIKGTVLFRPDKVKLDEDDKSRLKLLNLCDPYVNEFFFGGRIVVVEGDTEYTAFSRIKELYPSQYDDVHIIRARGKAIISSICKILNQFDSAYAVLHDADTEKTSDGKKNPAWKNNSNILDASLAINRRVNLIACNKDFEDAMFNEKILSDKPYHTYLKLEELDAQKNVKDLLDALLDSSKAPPAKCLRWKTICDLAPISEADTE